MHPILWYFNFQLREEEEIYDDNYDLVKPAPEPLRNRCDPNKCNDTFNFDCKVDVSDSELSKSEDGVKDNDPDSEATTHNKDEVDTISPVVSSHVLCRFGPLCLVAPFRHHTIFCHFRGKAISTFSFSYYLWDEFGLFL
ncbi:uncharacterized protein LOC119735982 [Patiria miniata]|uniref:Uncharacterized protein n=1 Tax=Patiria miniata TaxID=46514 RepID=A0A914APD2_PATMI|nr:uncharacterized protein LOC119735982 [Patiria miniata]